MPTFLNPFKSAFSAPAQQRLLWLREIFASYEDVIVSSYEVDLATQTPTIQSVEHLLEEYEKVYLVICADNLEKLHTWHRFDALAKKVTFIVVTRDDVEIPAAFERLQVDIAVSSTQLRKDIDINKLPRQNAEEIAQFYKENNAN